MPGLDDSVEEEEEEEEEEQGIIKGMEAHRLTIEDFVPERDESGAWTFLKHSIFISFAADPGLFLFIHLALTFSLAVSEARRVDLENAHKEALIDRRKHVYSGVTQRDLAVILLSLPFICATRFRPSKSCLPVGATAEYFDELISVGEAFSEYFHELISVRRTQDNARRELTKALENGWSNFSPLALKDGV